MSRGRANERLQCFGWSVVISMQRSTHSGLSAHWREQSMYDPRRAAQSGFCSHFIGSRAAARCVAPHPDAAAAIAAIAPSAPNVGAPRNAPARLTGAT